MSAVTDYLTCVPIISELATSRFSKMHFKQLALVAPLLLALVAGAPTPDGEIGTRPKTVMSYNMYPD